MKLAYVTEYDPNDIRAWSGTGTFILKSLIQQGLDVEHISPLHIPASHFLGSKLKTLHHKLGDKKVFLTQRTVQLAQEYARQAKRLLRQSKADLIFAPGSIPISYLEDARPIVIWSDSPFASMVDFYPEYSNLCEESIANGNKIDQAALDNCRLAIYSSDWAAQSGRHHYHVPADKIAMVPFGANIESAYLPRDIKTLILKRNRDICKLLFVGVNWNRKGGEDALEITRQLALKGIPVELAIVGCRLPIQPPDNVKVYGFLSKASSRDLAFLCGLYSESHFLLHPSQAEAFGIVIAEASAFALPAITRRVGGLTTTIREGRNGFTFEPQVSTSQIADCIAELWSNLRKYSELCFSSFEEYRTRINWNTVGTSVRELVEKILR